MKKVSRFALNAAILCLIWTVHYYAKRYTGGFVDVQDNVICGIVCLVCTIIILAGIVGIYKAKKGGKH